jgi:hypothetical protein
MGGIIASGLAYMLIGQPHNRGHTPAGDAWQQAVAG